MQNWTTNDFLKRFTLLLFSTHLTPHSDKLFIDSIIITEHRRHYTFLFLHTLDAQVDLRCLPIYIAVNFYSYSYSLHSSANYFYIHSRDWILHFKYEDYDTRSFSVKLFMFVTQKKIICIFQIISMFVLLLPLLLSKKFWWTW